MYGAYHGDITLNAGGASIGVMREGGLAVYRRTCKGETVEKVLTDPVETLLIHPVPPLYLPKAVSHHLEVSFPSVVAAPEDVAVVYLAFPVETGVFLKTGPLYDLLDIFSPEDAKYTLYGSAGGGKIARWCESAVTPEPPVTDPLRAAVLQLSVRNLSRNHIEVHRAVFEDATMYLYFDTETVFMTGIMDVFSESVAETRTMRKAPRDGMENALPPFAAKNLLPVEKGPFLMEFGV